MVTKSLRPRNGWAIVTDGIICCGWWFTRAEAIADYVYGRYGVGTSHAMGGKLSDEQLAYWRSRDVTCRVVKITISERR